MEGYSDESFVAGLGYSGRTTEDASQVEQLMQHYMQQCLDFHHQEEAKRNKHYEGPPVFLRSVAKTEDPATVWSPAKPDEKDKHAPLEAIPPCSTIHEDHLETSKARAEAIIAGFQNQEDNHDPAAIELDHDVVNSEKREDTKPAAVVESQQDSEYLLEASKAKAQMIVARFQQQQQQQDNTLLRSPSVFAAQRKAAFQREEEIKERFWAKNVEYAIHRQAQRLEKEAAEIENAQQWNSEYRAALDERHQARYEQRKLAAARSREQTTASAGIGTKRRRQQQKQSLPTVAVYVSGFPTDSTRVDTGFVSQLFSSYGQIRKLHFYRNKETGLLKGDGLVIYEVSPDQDANDLLQTVCGQMNGAELPSGEQLLVEASHSNAFKESKKEDEGSDTRPRTEASVLKDGPVAPQGEEDADDELDDFFSSV